TASSTATTASSRPLKLSASPWSRWRAGRSRAPERASDPRASLDGKAPKRKVRGLIAGHSAPVYPQRGSGRASAPLQVQLERVGAAKTRPSSYSESGPRKRAPPVTASRGRESAPLQSGDESFMQSQVSEISPVLVEVKVEVPWDRVQKDLN